MPKQLCSKLYVDLIPFEAFSKFPEEKKEGIKDLISFEIMAAKVKLKQRPGLKPFIISLLDGGVPLPPGTKC